MAISPTSGTAQVEKTLCTDIMPRHLLMKVCGLLCGAGVPDTPDNLYSFFLGRVRDRLHVILCFSPVGANFGRRAQQFPGLINGCLPSPTASVLGSLTSM